MDALHSFWSTWGPWITISLIPTVITGLSVMPSTQGAAGVVQKIWDIVKQALSFLSIATFKDQPGTFQAPIVGGLKMRQHMKLKRAEHAANRTNPPSPGITSTLALTVLMIFMMGSGTCKDTVKEIGTDTVNCAEAQIKGEVMNLLPTVIAILTGGATDWNEQLSALEVKGVAALTCAVAAAVQDFNSKTASSPAPSGAPENMKLAAGAAKGQEYINTKKVKLTNVGN